MNLKTIIKTLTMVIAISGNAASAVRVWDIKDIREHAIKLYGAKDIPMYELHAAAIVLLAKNDKNFAKFKTEKRAQKWLKLGQFYAEKKYGKKTVREDVKAYWNKSKKEIVVFAD